MNGKNVYDTNCGCKSEQNRRVKGIDGRRVGEMKQDIMIMIL